MVWLFKTPAILWHYLEPSLLELELPHGSKGHFNIVLCAIIIDAHSGEQSLLKEFSLLVVDDTSRTDYNPAHYVSDQ